MCAALSQALALFDSYEDRIEPIRICKTLKGLPAQPLRELMRAGANFILRGRSCDSVAVGNRKLVHRMAPLFGSPPRSAMTLRSASKINLVAVSSLAKCQRDLMIWHRRLCRASMALVV